jgi:hypothetical protein
MSDFPTPTELSIDTLRDIASAAGQSYTGIAIPEEDWKRLASCISKGDKSLIPDPVFVGGIQVLPNPNVPEGYAVAMLNGEPVGVIDFKGGDKHRPVS